MVSMKNLHPAWAALLAVAVGLLTGLVLSLFVSDISWGWVLVACVLCGAKAMRDNWRDRRAAAQSELGDAR